jgi:hypothetical protein
VLTLNIENGELRACWCDYSQYGLQLRVRFGAFSLVSSQDYEEVSWLEFREWAKVCGHRLTPRFRGETLTHRRARYQQRVRRLDAERGFGGPHTPMVP